MRSLEQRLRQSPVGARARSWRASIQRRQAHSGRFESQLTWIFGSPRSGSTWLLKLLAEHEAIVPINEPLVGWYLGPFLCDLPTGDAGSLDLSNFTLRRVQRYNPESFFAEQFSEVWRPALARMMRERFYAHAIRAAGSTRIADRRVVIKEPNGSQSADLIMRCLPTARMLFLLRDGRDVVDSELAGNLRGAWISRDFPGLSGLSDDERVPFVIQSAHKWLWRTEVVQQAFRHHPGPKLLLRYEHLLSDTEGDLRTLFTWLGLPVDSGVLRRWINTHAFDQINEDRGPQKFFRAAHPGGWRQNLRPQEQSAVAQVIGPKLAELGYET